MRQKLFWCSAKKSICRIANRCKRKQLIQAISDFLAFICRLFMPFMYAGTNEKHLIGYFFQHCRVPRWDNDLRCCTIAADGSCAFTDRKEENQLPCNRMQACCIGWLTCYFFNEFSVSFQQSISRGIHACIKTVCKHLLTKILKELA